MTTLKVSDAKEQLSAPLVMVEHGEEVGIARAGRSIARLVPYERPKERRKLGALREQISIRPDFDAPEPEKEVLFYGTPFNPAD